MFLQKTSRVNSLVRADARGFGSKEEINFSACCLIIEIKAE